MSTVEYVKFHTTILIKGQYHNYLNPDVMEKSGFTVSETEHGITIENKSSLIKVGWPNIVYLQTSKADTAPKKAAKA